MTSEPPFLIDEGLAEDQGQLRLIRCSYPSVHNFLSSPRYRL